MKINSAYRNYSSNWFVRRKLTPEEEKEIIATGKKASKNKKIPDKEFIKPFHHDINFIDEEDDYSMKADVNIILDRMIPTRKQLYEDMIDVHRNIRINERLRCVFRKMGDLTYSYVTVDLPREAQHDTNTTLHNKGQIDRALIKNNEAYGENVKLAYDQYGKYAGFEVY